MNNDKRSKPRPKTGKPARGDARGGDARRGDAKRGDARRGTAGPRDGVRRGTATARPRRDGAPTRSRTGEARPRREGHAPRGRTAGPREGFRSRPRGDGRGEGFRPRGERTGSGAGGRTYRSDRPAPRSERGGPSRKFADRPRFERARPERPQAERPRFERARPERSHGERTRFERARPGRPQAERPRFERARPERSQGERPRFERARPERSHGERPRFERARPGRPQAERPRFERARPERPQAERPRFERARPERSHGERPRFERAQPGRPQAERPRFERARPERPHVERQPSESQRPGRPQPDRPRSERPRPERPRFERPRADRPAFHDEGGDQTGAVNRSRPAYSQGPNVRWRRDGKRSDTARTGVRPGPWSERAHDRPHHANGGPGARPAAAHHAPIAPATDGPSLPADPREAALRILHAVDTRSAFSDRLLDGAHARPGADPRDRALLHELVKGALRWRGRIDAAVDARVHVGLANTQPWIRNILRLGAYQILFLDRIPAHAAVDESVKLAHKYAHAGAAGLVNSVLRRLAEERDAIRWPEGDDAVSLAAWGSHPLWIVERWLARFGAEETRALLSADNRTVPTGLRTNTLKNSREQLIVMLASEGVEARLAKLSPDLVWVEGHHSPGALHCFRSGLCTAQDESEALVGRVVAPRPHERVLDLCAAPGGKSTHLAELMRDDGEVWAMERDAHRVETLKATLARLGTHSVHVVHGDGRTYEFPMPFDRVLVDAPCSGMGVLARRADARWRKGPEVLAEMPPVQLDLLRSAARRVVPGGVLVYSVCSFEPEETDHVVARFLSEHPGWTLESVAGAVPEAVVTPEGFMLLLPHRHGCDGAFAARFRKP